MNIQYNMKIQDYLSITLGVKSLDFMHNMQMHASCWIPSNIISITTLNTLS